MESRATIFRRILYRAPRSSFGPILRSPVAGLDTADRDLRATSSLSLRKPFLSIPSKSACIDEAIVVDTT
jgi:hypothetical protein